MIKPISAIWINFIHDDEKIRYTDCFESSLLRYFHICFSKIKYGYPVIDIDKIKSYLDMNSLYCKKLLTFFEFHNDIYETKTYYSSYLGKIERQEWCKILNNIPNLRYVNKSEKGYSYELCSCMENIHIFFKLFLPKYKFGSRIMTKWEDNVECSIYPKCKGKKILRTDSFVFGINGKYRWELTQFFEKTGERITGHSEIY
jgi:hypothetical protein